MKKVEKDKRKMSKSLLSDFHFAFKTSKGKCGVLLTAIKCLF
jgi:hypothetical protein